MKAKQCPDCGCLVKWEDDFECYECGHDFMNDEVIGIVEIIDWEYELITNNKIS